MIGVQVSPSPSDRVHSAAIFQEENGIVDGLDQHGPPGLSSRRVDIVPEGTVLAAGEKVIMQVTDIDLNRSHSISTRSYAVMTMRQDSEE